MRNDLKIGSVKNILEFEIVVTTENNRRFNITQMPNMNDLPFLCENLGLSLTEVKQQIQQHLLSELSKLERL